MLTFTHPQEAARAARMRASGLISEDAFAEAAALEAGEGAAAAAAADPAVAERQYQVRRECVQGCLIAVLISSSALAQERQATDAAQPNPNSATEI